MKYPQDYSAPGTQMSVNKATTMFKTGHTFMESHPVEHMVCGGMGSIFPLKLQVIKVSTETLHMAGTVLKVLC